jgi:hypothetical protein
LAHHWHVRVRTSHHASFLLEDRGGPTDVVCRGRTIDLVSIGRDQVREVPCISPLFEPVADNRAGGGLPPIEPRTRMIQCDLVPGDFLVEQGDLRGDLGCLPLSGPCL